MLKTTLKIRQKSGSVAKYREEWSDSRLRDSLCGVFFSEYFYSLNKEMLNFTNIGKLFTPPPPPPKVSNYKTLLRASGT